MGRQKYKTEEERLEAKREYMKRYRQENKEKIAERKKQYYQVNKGKRSEYFKQYYQDNKEKIAEYNQDNKEKKAEYNKQYRQANKEKIAEYRKQYNQIPMGRAKNLVRNYEQEDKKRNRGECTLTAQWIVDRIFSQKCVYCGEDDWRQLGCDRKNNSLPHTPDNVVCCCGECNKKRGTKPFEEFINEIR